MVGSADHVNTLRVVCARVRVCAQEAAEAEKKKKQEADDAKLKKGAKRQAAYLNHFGKFSRQGQRCADPIARPGRARLRAGRATFFA